MRTLLIPIKQVINPYIKPRVKADHSGVEKNQVKMSVNPFDEIALEEAVRLKEKGLIDEVVLVCVGDEKCQETLRYALALGGDRAILVLTETELEPLHVAKILEHIIANEKPLAVLMGKQSIDGDNNQTGQMLAARLNWPQATFASQITWADAHVVVTREVDGGLQTIQCSLPAVITVDLRLNEPRYASLPNIMKAKSKPITQVLLSAFGISLNSHTQILRVTEPALRQGGEILPDVTSLVFKLKTEAKVLD